VRRALDTVIDDTDVAILEILQRDGRESYSAIARQLDLPESTVRQRCKRILESQLISIVATGDPLRWGVAVDAVHRVRIEPLHVEALTEAISAMPEVRYVGVALGASVLIVESLHPSNEDLHHFLAARLPALPGVKEVETHQIVDNKKSVWDWRAWLRPRATAPLTAPHERQLDLSEEDSR